MQTIDRCWSCGAVIRTSRLYCQGCDALHKQLWAEISAAGLAVGCDSGGWFVKKITDGIVVSARYTRAMSAMSEAVAALRAEARLGGTESGMSSDER
jgi:hypothetical protein